MEPSPAYNRNSWSEGAHGHRMPDAKHHALPFKCTLCLSFFCSLKELVKHVCDEPFHWKCARCGYRTRFGNAAALSEHQALKHNCCSCCWANLDEDAKKKCGTCVGQVATSALSAAVKAPLSTTPTSSKADCSNCYQACGSTLAMLVHFTALCPFGIDQDQFNDIALCCQQSSRYRVPQPINGHKFSCPECSGEFESMTEVFIHVQRGVACTQAMGLEEPLAKLFLYLEGRIAGRT